MEFKETTCDCCGRVYLGGAKRYYCSHCDKFFHVCTSCEDRLPKCRFCSIPLKKKRQPQQKERRVKSA